MRRGGLTLLVDETIQVSYVMVNMVEAAGAGLEDTVL